MSNLRGEKLYPDSSKMESNKVQSHDDQATRDLRPRHRQGINEQKPKTSSPSHLELMADLEKLKADETLEEDAPIKKYMNDQNKKIYQNAKPNKEERTSKETSSSCSTTMLISVVVVAILVASIFCFAFDDSPSIPSTSNDVQQNLKELEKYFPSQSSRTWMSLRAGARDFVNASPLQRPLVILLTGDSKATRCLGEKYIQAFQRNLYSLDAAEVSGKDYGETIDLLRENIDRKGAVLLRGLQNLDGNQAAALHVVCDRESPLVRDAVVVLTADKSLEEIGDKWRDHVSTDKLPALLTRIGSRIVTVSLEQNLPCG